jgi:hypothetical protein
MLCELEGAGQQFLFAAVKDIGMLGRQHSVLD